MNSFWKKTWKFLKTPIVTHITHIADDLSHQTRTFSLVALFALIIVLPVTLIVLQQQTHILQHANSATVLYKCNQNPGYPPHNGIDEIDENPGGYPAYKVKPNARYCASNQYCNSSAQVSNPGDLCSYIPAPPCSSLGGTCQYSGCTNGSLNGSCSSGYMQCCKPAPAPTPTTCHGNGYCIHYSPQICPSGDQTISDGSCGSGGFDRCCVPSADYCQYATQGDGGYCGSVLGNGADTNFVYTCSGKTTSNKEDCSNKGGCVVNSSGSDYCKDDKGGGGGGGCDTVKVYNECEQGNATYCLSNGVPKGHLAEVTQTTCGYSCKDLGPCVTPKDTKIVLNVKLDGIGSKDFDNNNPKHPKRTGSVRVYDVADSSKTITGSSQGLNFDKAKGNFASDSVDLGTGLSETVTYKVEVKLPGYLPAAGDVKYGDTSQVINITPIGGDINKVDDNGVVIGDGKVDINDYSILRQCRNVDPNTTISFQSNSKSVGVKCGDLVNFFDFPEGGTMENVLFTFPGGTSVGEWDVNYNLWLRWYLQANGF